MTPSHDTPTPRRFAGRTALVTGAASGIGLATAAGLAREGAVVVGIDRSAERIGAMRPDHPRIEMHARDLADHAGVESIVAGLVARHQHLDILVNNAGIEYMARHVDSTLDQWRHTQAVNAEAMYVLAKLVVPHMMRRRYGRIVNVASVKGCMSTPGNGAYSASKAAVLGWTRAMATELSEHGIGVNAVAPGWIATSMRCENEDDHEVVGAVGQCDDLTASIPMRRPGRPEEVADAILFLCSEGASYITGHTMVVDGGMTIAL